MTAPFTIPGYDAWLFRERDPLPDYSGLTIESEEEDMLNWLSPFAVRDGDGRLIGARLGNLPLSLDQLRLAIGDDGVERFAHLGNDELNAARADYDEAMIEQMGEGRDD